MLSRFLRSNKNAIRLLQLRPWGFSPAELFVQPSAGHRDAGVHWPKQFGAYSARNASISWQIHRERVAISTCLRFTHGKPAKSRVCLCCDKGLGSASGTCRRARRPGSAFQKADAGTRRSRHIQGKAPVPHAYSAAFCIGIDRRSI